MTDKLRELAEAATAGPWVYRAHPVDDWGYVRQGGADGHFVAIGRAGGDYDSDAHRAAKTDPYGPNAAYIAAANPTTILALLDDLDEAKAIIRAFCRSGGSASSGMVTTGVWSLDKLAEAEKRALTFLSKGEGE